MSCHPAESPFDFHGDVDELPLYTAEEPQISEPEDTLPAYGEDTFMAFKTLAASYRDNLFKEHATLERLRYGEPDDAETLIKWQEISGKMIRISIELEQRASGVNLTHHNAPVEMSHEFADELLRLTTEIPTAELSDSIAPGYKFYATSGNWTEDALLDDIRSLHRMALKKDSFLDAALSAAQEGIRACDTLISSTLNDTVNPDHWHAVSRAAVHSYLSGLAFKGSAYAETLDRSVRKTASMEWTTARTAALDWYDSIRGDPEQGDSASGSGRML